MSQPFEVTDDGKMRIVGAQFTNNAQIRWRALISKDPKRHVIGFTFERALCAK
jgi:hypothetical protein